MRHTCSAVKDNHILSVIVEICVDVSTEGNERFYRARIVRVEREVSHIVNVLFDIILSFRRQVVYSVAIVVFGTQVSAQLSERIVFVKISHHRYSVRDVA